MPDLPITSHPVASELGRWSKNMARMDICKSRPMQRPPGRRQGNSISIKNIFGWPLGLSGGARRSRAERLWRNFFSGGWRSAASRPIANQDGTVGWRELLPAEKKFRHKQRSRLRRVPERRGRVGGSPSETDFSRTSSYLCGSPFFGAGDRALGLAENGFLQTQHQAGVFKKFRPNFKNSCSVRSRLLPSALEERLRHRLTEAQQRSFPAIGGPLADMHYQCHEGQRFQIPTFFRERVDAPITRRTPRWNPSCPIKAMGSRHGLHELLRPKIACRTVTRGYGCALTKR